MGTASLSILPYSHSRTRKFLLIPSVSRNNCLVTDSTRQDVEFSPFSSDGSRALLARFLPICDKASRDYRYTIARTFTITTCATRRAGGKKRYRKDKTNTNVGDRMNVSRFASACLADIIPTFLFHPLYWKFAGTIRRAERPIPQRQYRLHRKCISPPSSSSSFKDKLHVSRLNSMNRQSYASSLHCCIVHSSKKDL